MNKREIYTVPEKRIVCVFSSISIVLLFCQIVIKFMTSFQHMRSCMDQIVIYMISQVSLVRNFLSAGHRPASQPCLFVVLRQRLPLRRRPPPDSMVILPILGVGLAVNPPLRQLMTMLGEYLAWPLPNGEVRVLLWNGPFEQGRGLNHYPHRRLGNMKHHLAKGWQVLNFRDPDDSLVLVHNLRRRLMWNTLCWRNFGGRQVSCLGWPF